jgi:hypothetical protein
MSQLKKAIYKKKRLNKVIIPIYHGMKRSRNFSSKDYWEKRYKKGGNSGAGSYGRLAKYKASYLNDFTKANKISSVIEFGSGDGSQLKLFSFKGYIGLDVSKTSIALCLKKFAKDNSKSFYLYDSEFFRDNHHLFSADLTLSLDVIYHLVEDRVFDKYMRDLFSASNKYVIIYASNTDENKKGQAQHVKHRQFTKWVKQNEKAWKLVDQMSNKYGLETNEIDESFADFYIFQKR